MKLQLLGVEVGMQHLGQHSSFFVTAWQEAKQCQWSEGGAMYISLYSLNCLLLGMASLKSNRSILDTDALEWPDEDDGGCF